ncbi:WD40 repeat-like protein [Gyrodon lividus]|nr:WD40 repeat-like protein [Gyrodon lividus]
MPSTSGEPVDLAAKPLLSITGHKRKISGIAFLPGDKRIVTCSWDETIRIWDVTNGEQQGAPLEHGASVHCMIVTRDGKRILSGGGDRKVRVWDVEIWDVVEEWEGHQDAVYCIDITADDTVVASGERSGGIVIREAKEGGRVKHSIKLQGDVYSLCFSPNGEKLASGDTNSTIQVFDVESGSLILGPIQGHQSTVLSVLWSRDASQLFSGSSDYTIRCWDSETGNVVGEPWTGHNGIVRSLAIFHGSKSTKLASASWDRTVRFWAADSGNPIIEHPLQHKDDSNAIAFSNSGEFVASGGDHGNVLIWRVPWWDESQKELQHNSFNLDLPAIAPSNTNDQRPPRDLDLGFLDLPATRRPFGSYRQDGLHPAVTNTEPIATRLQRFWQGLFSPRLASSLASQAVEELQPMHGRRSWKSPVRTPVIEVYAGRDKRPVVVGRRERRKKKKHHKPHKPAGTTTTASSPPSATQGAADNAGHSNSKLDSSASQAGPSGSGGGPSTIQAGPSTQGRTSGFSQSDGDSDDSWDDMDCCGKCLDYFCVGPRADRETFRPWRKKPRALFEAEERAREEKRRQAQRNQRRY